MRRCLVTGATGFLGKQLVKCLAAEGFFVRVLLRRPCVSNDWHECVQGELTERPENYRAAMDGMDTVFHLAGIAHSREEASRYQSINCEATLALARAAELAGVQRFVFVSSVKAVADPGSSRVDETFDTWPADPYGYWKRKAEQRLLDEIALPHLAILRPTLMYGPGVKGNLYRMLSAIDRGYFPPLPETGAVRSMVAAADVASALLLVAEAAAANRTVLIAADGEAYTAHLVYQAMRQALGYQPASRVVPVNLLRVLAAAGDGFSRCFASWPFNSEVLSRLTGPASYSADRLLALGWQPSTTLYRELPAMVAAYRQGER